MIENYVCYLMCVKCQKAKTNDIENSTATANNDTPIKTALLANGSKSSKCSTGGCVYNQR